MRISDLIYTLGTIEAEHGDVRVSIADAEGHVRTIPPPKVLLCRDTDTEEVSIVIQ